jgi:predicted regulator of Ras-like GTPase activity (Roadblock/LC7/MglB family)
MLTQVLQSLRDVEGVQGAMIVDHAAAVVAHRAHTIYDIPVLQQVARSVINAVESVQLIQDDWDVLTAHFGEGKLVLRNLRIPGAKPRRYVLTVIADPTLNVAFLGVALRVAAAKLLTALELPPEPAAVSATPSALLRGGSIRLSGSEVSGPVLERAGLAWSGTDHSVTASTSQVATSQVATSEVSVADAGSSAFLSACARALAVSMGPIAKRVVKDAVRKVCGERAFSRADAPALITRLSSGIEDGDDREAFLRATRVL